MNIRDEINNEYKVENGVIKSPGKFEGEAVYVPYFWDCFLDGFVDEDDGDLLTFFVTDEDKQFFPELEGKDAVRLFQRDDGFVCEV